MNNILILGETWGNAEEEARSSFIGPSGKILDGLLRQTGLRRKDCFLTSVFNIRPRPSENIVNLCGNKIDGIPGFPAVKPGKYILNKYRSELDRLYAEINTVNPNVIIACGNIALWALTGHGGFNKFRGTAMLSTRPELVRQFKIIPTFHPVTVMRDWKLRPIALADFDKASRESAFPELRRPQRFIHIAESVIDVRDFISRYIPENTHLSVDIETIGDQITSIAFSPSPYLSLVIPIFTENGDKNYWKTLEDELEIWRMIKILCENNPTFGQNFLYDMNFLWRAVGIRCMQQIDDTMLMHHAMQPEMKKGLGFLGSIYTDEVSWKFMRDVETNKRED